MSESIYKNKELENEVSSDMSYFWYSDVQYHVTASDWDITKYSLTCSQNIMIALSQECRVHDHREIGRAHV